MEKMIKKHENLQKMIIALEKSIKALEKHHDDAEAEFFRDSVIARFKILIESTWKNIKLILEERGFAEVPSSPKGVLHFALEAAFLTQEEHDELLKYLSLRNLASHLYDEPQYNLVVYAAKPAISIIQKIMLRMQKPF